MVAEGNDALLEEFFEKGTLPVEHIIDGLRQAIRERRIYPVLCGSALHNVGSDLLMNFIVENFPAPTEHEPISGTSEWRRRSSAGHQERPSPPRHLSSRPSPIRSPAASLTSK